MNSTSVSDPDHKIDSWILEDEEDEYIVGRIEEDGSVITFLDASQKKKEKFYELGFRVSAAEKVRKSAEWSELGDLPANVFQTAVHMYCTDITVVGTDTEKYGDRRCFRTFYLSKPHSSYEFGRWMDSVFDVASGKKRNIFFFAHYEYTSKSMRELFDELFPEMKVVHNDGNLCIELDELKKILE